MKAAPNSELWDVAGFFSLSHAERLEKIRGLKGGGQMIAAMTQIALARLMPEGKVSEQELFEILFDYLQSPGFHEFYIQYHWDNHETHDQPGSMWQAGQDIEALWGLIPKVPESISYRLLEFLPAECGFFFDIPQSLLNRLNSRQLGILFARQDIKLKSLRRDIFFSVNPEFDSIRDRAVLYNFDLTQDQFGDLLQAALSKTEASENAKLNLSLLTYAEHLNPVFYDVLQDILSSLPDPAYKDDAARAARKLNRRLDRPVGLQYESYLWELQLYRLAKQVAPWKRDENPIPLSQELEFLKSAIEPNDTWTTFKAFSRTWRKNWPLEELEKYLPRLDDEWSRGN